MAATQASSTMISRILRGRATRKSTSLASHSVEVWSSTNRQAVPGSSPHASVRESDCTWVAAAKRAVTRSNLKDANQPPPTSRAGAARRETFVTTDGTTRRPGQVETSAVVEGATDRDRGADTVTLRAGARTPRTQEAGHPSRPRGISHAAVHREGLRRHDRRGDRRRRRRVGSNLLPLLRHEGRGALRRSRAPARDDARAARTPDRPTSRSWPRSRCCSASLGDTLVANRDRALVQSEVSKARVQILGLFRQHQEEMNEVIATFVATRLSRHRPGADAGPGGRLGGDGRLPRGQP